MLQSMDKCILTLSHYPAKMMQKKSRSFSEIAKLVFTGNRLKYSSLVTRKIKRDIKYEHDIPLWV